MFESILQCSMPPDIEWKQNNNLNRWDSLLFFQGLIGKCLLIRTQINTSKLNFWIEEEKVEKLKPTESHTVRQSLQQSSKQKYSLLMSPALQPWMFCLKRTEALLTSLLSETIPQERNNTSTRTLPGFIIKFQELHPIMFSYRGVKVLVDKEWEKWKQHYAASKTKPFEA